MIKGKLALLGTLGLLGASSLAVAASGGSAEVVSLNVLFEVPWCTWTPNGNSETCTTAASLGKNVAISLDHCTIADHSTECSGSWYRETEMDGYPFASSIKVTKITHDSGQPTYTLSALVGSVLNSKEPAGGEITLNQDGTLTNSVTFNGPKLYISRQDGFFISYKPYLLINPKFTAPEQPWPLMF